jgi:hypothetical protein
MAIDHGMRMHPEKHDESRSVNIVHCAECARRCVDVGALLLEFGWRSEIVAGKTRWRCAGCLGSAPDVAVIFKTIRGHRRAA